MVQVQQVPTGTVKARIKSIKPAGTTTTYDIGVSKNHNFFANDVLVHNCQHDAASSMAHLHNVIDPAMVLGLTATPFRTDRMKLCFDKVIKDAGIHQLIQDGYLSKFDHYTIPKWDPQTVANFYYAEPEKWGKSIFYFVNLEQCFKLQQIFRELGVVSEVVTGDSDVDQQLVRFRTGEIQCLINCMKLTEGFDEPSLKTAWVRDSGKGPTMQMGGRAFRKHPDLPVKNIVQSADTHWPFIKTAMPRLQYLWQSNTWASLQVNPFIEEITQQARMAIATVEVSLPKFLTDRLQKKRRLRRV
jgi:superfamily II DNA or RNA helicase